MWKGRIVHNKEHPHHIMKVTFILKDKTDWFFTGNADRYPEGHAMRVTGLLNMPDNLSRFRVLDAQSRESYQGVAQKIGTSNAFRDRVELNQILRSSPEPSFKLENRRGYKLATFEF